MFRCSFPAPFHPSTLSNLASGDVVLCRMFALLFTFPSTSARPPAALGSSKLGPWVPSTSLAATFKATLIPLQFTVIAFRPISV